MSGETLSRRDFLRRVLGAGGIAVASSVLAACAPGEGDDDEEEDEEDD